MTERKIYFGSIGPFVFDDADLVADQDGEFPGETFKGLLTSAEVTCSVLNAGTSPGEGLDDTFTVNTTGFSSNPSGTARYTKLGSVVVLHLPSLIATSNAGTFTITGIPSEIQAQRISSHGSFIAVDNSADQGTPGLIEVSTGSAWNIYKDWAKNNWTSSGNKGLRACTIAYSLL